jgi:hypothetical protein
LIISTSKVPQKTDCINRVTILVSEKSFIFINASCKLAAYPPMNMNNIRNPVQFLTVSTTP